jgi:hypothetical protein
MVPERGFLVATCEWFPAVVVVLDSCTIKKQENNVKYILQKVRENKP